MQFQFSVCMYGTCGRIDNKADFDFLTLTLQHEQVYNIRFTWDSQVSHMFHMGIYMCFTCDHMGFTWEFTCISHVISWVSYGNIHGSHGNIHVSHGNIPWISHRNLHVFHM